MKQPNLRKLGPCKEGLEYAESFSSLQEAWDNCERGDWMLWLAGARAGKPWSDKRKRLVLAACECARLVLKYVSKNDSRPLEAIVTAEAWANGEPSVTLEDARAAAAAARAAAHAAAHAADARAAAYAAAAYAAAYAAAAAYTAAADAAYDAANAAYAAAHAADAAYAAVADARKKIMKKCADIVREFYPKVPR